MKKKIFTLATIAVIVSVIGLIVFSACSKQPNEIEQATVTNNLTSKNGLFSYTGEPISYNPEFENKYEMYGKYHNYLMDCISYEWLNEDFEIETTDFFEFVASKFQQINGFNTGINYDTIISDIKTSLLECYFDELTPQEQIDLIKSSLRGGDYTRFLKDIDDCINNSKDTIELLHQFDIIAQKVSNSSYNEDVKMRYLIYCVVYKYSIMNIVHIYNDPKSGFHNYLFGSTGDSKGLLNKIKQVVKEHPVAASDAVGAVVGAVTCAKYGVAGGPAGVAVTAVAGGVVRGACSSAMSAAGRQIIHEIRH